MITRVPELADADEDSTAAAATHTSAATPSLDLITYPLDESVLAEIRATT